MNKIFTITYSYFLLVFIFPSSESYIPQAYNQEPYTDTNDNNSNNNENNSNHQNSDENVAKNGFHRIFEYSYTTSHEPYSSSNIITSKSPNGNIVYNVKQIFQDHELARKALPRFSYYSSNFQPSQSYQPYYQINETDYSSNSNNQLYNYPPPPPPPPSLSSSSSSTSASTSASSALSISSSATPSALSSSSESSLLTRDHLYRYQPRIDQSNGNYFDYSTSLHQSHIPLFMKRLAHFEERDDDDNDEDDNDDDDLDGKNKKNKNKTNENNKYNNYYNHNHNYNGLSKITYEPRTGRALNYDENLSKYYNNDDSTNRSDEINDEPKLRMVKVKMGKQNEYGRPWGTKTTLTYHDPKKPTNFMQVTEVKMNMNKNTHPFESVGEVKRYVNDDAAELNFDDDDDF